MTDVMREEIRKNVQVFKADDNCHRIHKIMAIFKQYCFDNGCKHKIVGDYAYKNRYNYATRIIRLKTGANNIVKIYDTTKGIIEIPYNN